MQAHLWKSRKHLSIMVGALKAQQPTVSLSPFALQANEFVETEEIEGMARDSSPVPANASPLVLQFFQVLAHMRVADYCLSACPLLPHAHLQMLGLQASASCTLNICNAEAMTAA